MKSKQVRYDIKQKWVNEFLVTELLQHTNIAEVIILFALFILNGLC